MDKVKSRVESEIEIKAFVQNLRYALSNGARMEFQIHRRVDEDRPELYTNEYAVNRLFPNEDPVSAIKRELMSISEKDYIQTVKDLRFPNRSEMREFGKKYDGEGDVYIKLRVELIGIYGSTTIFVMSFHFAEKPFATKMFPFKKEEVPDENESDLI